MICAAGERVKNALQIFIAVCFLLNLNGIQVTCGYEPKQLTIETNCGAVVDLEKSLLLTIKNWSALPDNGSYCQIEFHSISECHKGGENRIQVSILKLDFPGTQSPCENESRVDVMDDDGKTFISDPHGLCGQISDMRFSSTSDLLYLRVTSRDKNLDGKLKILATAYNLMVCNTDKEFACDNHRCICDSLTCNGYNDCGDTSDENDGCWLTTDVIAVIAVVSVALIVLLVVISVAAYKRKLSWVLRDAFRWGRF